MPRPGWVPARTATVAVSQTTGSRGSAEKRNGTCSRSGTRDQGMQQQPQRQVASQKGGRCCKAWDMIIDKSRCVGRLLVQQQCSQCCQHTQHAAVCCAGIITSVWRVFCTQALQTLGMHQQHAQHLMPQHAGCAGCLQVPGDAKLKRVKQSVDRTTKVGFCCS